MFPMTTITDMQGGKLIDEIFLHLKYTRMLSDGKGKGYGIRFCYQIILLSEMKGKREYLYW